MSWPIRSASANELPPLVKQNNSCATSARGEKPTLVRVRTSNPGMPSSFSHNP
ncbi:MAG: hypothetical protein PHV34_23680 [Verrucomicrobiae bacterium]|nr:hypothetical protein [Verrucomicrobiae bacterium]